MKAVQIYEFGGPDVLKLEEIPRPEPAAGEILVKVLAAGVNPVDWKTRAGRGVSWRYGTEQFPIILGWDISGVVEAVGSGTEDFEVGDAVFGMPCFPELAAANAQYAAVPASEMALKPAALTHVEAAGLPLVSLTAWQALFEAAELAAGQRILIHAAAGGVGHVAVQLAKWKQAVVTGTASSRNESYLRQIGVDHFVDYQSQRFEEVVSGMDCVLDTVGGETRQRSWAVLRPGGILVSITGAPEQETAVQHKVRAASVLVRPHGPQLAAVAELVDAGKIVTHIDQVFPLADIAAAHAYVHQAHTRGKVVLVP